jgi:MFS family permease
MLDIQKRLTALFYVILSLPTSAMGFALSVQIAALSWILETQYELAIDEIGLVWAAGPIAGIVGQLVFGLLSDQAWFWGGRRRPFILIGGVLAALMLLALPNIDNIARFLNAESLLGIAILVALTLDLSINVGFNPTRSIIADVTPAGDERTKGYTWMQTISGSFGVLAYVIGAAFGNYFLIYSGAILVLLLSIIPPFFITEPRELADPGSAPEPVPVDESVPIAPETTTSSSPAPDDSKRLQKALLAILPLWGYLVYAVYGIYNKVRAGAPLSNTGLWIFAAIIFLPPLYSLTRREDRSDPLRAGRIGFQKVLAAHAFTWIGVQTMFIYTFAFLQQRLPDLTQDGLGSVINIAFLVLNLVAAILPAVALEPLARRIGRVRTHLLCILVMTLGYAGIAYLGYSAAIIYGFMAIVGIGWAATVSLPFAIMSAKVDQRQMGLFMGLFNLSVVLPQLVASLGIGEYLSVAADKGVVFTICMICLALSTVGWSTVRE